MTDVLHTLGAVAAVAYALLLLVVAPVMGKRRFHRLVDAIASDPAARGRFYRKTVVRSWAITVGALTVIGLLTGRTPASIGLRGPTNGHSFAGPTLIGACVGLGLGAILVTLVARKPSGRETLRKAMGPAAVILPTTAYERRYFLLVSLTAGVTALSRVLAFTVITRRTFTALKNTSARSRSCRSSLIWLIAPASRSFRTKWLITPALIIPGLMIRRRRRGSTAPKPIT